MVEFLKNELERCKVAITKAEPGTEAYRNALAAMNELRYILDCEKRPILPEPVIDDFAPSSDIEKGEEAPVVAEPVKKEAPAPSAPKMKKEDVRAALADARLKGVDVSKLISGLGAANLSGVDPDDYPKLMDALAAELEGK